MKLIKPSFEIIDQPEGPSGIDKMIEIAGRTCYKSEDKMTEDSAKSFVERMIKSGHTAMLEHGTVYLQLLDTYLDPDDVKVSFGNYAVNHYINNKYSSVRIIHDDEWKANVYITTNYRVLVENGWLGDLNHLCEPTDYHVKRVTVKFICDRGVSHEFVRHRVFSFAQESTRYCNYSSKDKFGSKCTFIIPCWTQLKEGEYELFEEDESLEGLDCINTSDNNSYVSDLAEKAFLRVLDTAERDYFNLLKQGWTAQQARAVLPNALKTELVMTGTTEQWEGFFKLRDDEKHAHPQAYELAHGLHEEFKKKGLCTL